MLTLANADISKLASAGEVFAVLVERNSHDSIGGVESFLDTITVVDVDVDVEDALVEPQELEDAEDDVYEIMMRICG